ncbi:unnamed protein product [Haemonchus placei]|uniref:PAZ domain-containing protein n=1 Tax=Haemonchus placei TaxID=6290 RepID=A0A0N4XAG1_HAEPC|nr:unnamed protein product [Haemonchus placei]
MAACVAGLENRPFHYCVNATWINGVKGGHNITEDSFRKFYDDCNMLPLPTSIEESEISEDDESNLGWGK